MKKIYTMKKITGHCFFKHPAAVLFALVFAFEMSIISCATSRPAKLPDSVSSDASDFAVQEQGGVQQFTLENGIPVYIKENHSNRLVSLYVIVRGGTALLKPEYSGLEMALMRMMKSGSEKYSYSDLQDLLYRTHADFFGFAQTEGSGLGIECLDYYFDDLLMALADGFLHPAFGENEFTTMKKEYSQRLQSTLNDPSSLAFYTAVKSIYKNHPYETQPSVTLESIDNITIENMQNLHAKILDARRISIVVVGNIKASKIAKKLNTLFSSIPALEDNFILPEVKPVIMGDKNSVLANPSAAGTGFMIQCFTTPAVTDADYAAACLASDMYSDVLYQVVREEHGACYTPSSAVLSSKAPFGAVVLYRVSDLENASSYVREAQKIMESGKLIAGRNADNSFVFEQVSGRLESYKNMYINRKYAQMQTNSGVAGRIGGSIFQFGDAVSADAMVEKARAVTADDIQRVFEKYFVQGKKQWFCVTGPGDENKIKF